MVGRVGFVGWLVLLLGGCPDGAGPGDAGAQDAGAHDAGAGLVSFQQDIVPIFQGHCLDCHFTGAYLDLTPEHAGDSLFQPPQNTCFENGTTVARPRVDPGEPDNSLLWIKIADLDFSLECGREMPLGQPEGPLLQGAPDEAQRIYDWIVQGAVIDAP